MKIEVFGPKTIPRSRLGRLSKRIIEAEGTGSSALNLIFVTNRFIRRLNRKFLKRDRPTNVLAFPGEADFFGEIYISIDYAKKEAKDLNIDLTAELDRLVIHGLLHLLGYNHSTMKAKEKKYLRWGNEKKG